MLSDSHADQNEKKKRNNKSMHLILYRVGMGSGFEALIN